LKLKIVGPFGRGVDGFETTRDGRRLPRLELVLSPATIRTERAVAFYRNISADRGFS
jgi:hypothetical protein